MCRSRPPRDKIYWRTHGFTSCCCCFSFSQQAKQTTKKKESLDFLPTCPTARIRRKLQNVSSAQTPRPTTRRSSRDRSSDLLFQRHKSLPVDDVQFLLSGRRNCSPDGRPDVNALSISGPRARILARVCLSSHVTCVVPSVPAPSPDGGATIAVN